MSCVLLIAGVGNLFLGDDGFGPAVAHRLASRLLPNGVEVRDFGIRGFDLAYALEQCAAAILVDVTTRGEPPGTLYVIEPTPDEFRGLVGMDPHGMTPDRVLGFCGALPGCLRLVGCEPASFGDPEVGRMGLSPEVSAAVEPAADLVMQLVAELGVGLASHA
jgi:hydrogenase maturation protease